MLFTEAFFWFGITFFGTGLYFLLDGTPKSVGRWVWLSGITFVGLVMCGYCVYAHYYGAPKPPLWVALLLLTWLLIGFDVYDRRKTKAAGYAINTSECDELYADTVFAWLKGNIHTAGTFSSVGVSPLIGLPENAINRGLDLLKTKYKIVRKPSPSLDSWSYNGFYRSFQQG